ncbi:MAG: hypothetical protein SFV52_02175 [Saprospiraceae bacterium]|nr:hypothetical protein [Saprospiraceae bacterium]
MRSNDIATTDFVSPAKLLPYCRILFLIVFYFLSWAVSCVNRPAENGEIPPLPVTDTVLPKIYPPIYDFVFKYDYPERWHLIDTVFNNSYRRLDKKDELEFRIKTLESAAEKHRDPKAMLLAKMIRFAYTPKFYNPAESEITYAYRELMRESEHIHFEEAKPSIMSQYGYFLKNLFNKDVLSLYYLIKSMDEIKKIPPDYIPHQGDFITVVAKVFYDYADFDKAIEYGKMALQFEMSNTYRVYNYNMLGMAYLKTMQDDTAQVYFNHSKSALLHYRNELHPGWGGIIEGNIAHVYKHKGDWETAISLYKYAIDQTYKYQVLDNTCGFAISLADIYLQQHNIQELERTLPLAVSTTHTAGQFINRYDLHKLLSDYYLVGNNYRMALIHKDSAYQWADSIAAHTGKNVQIQAQLNLETERRKSSDEALQVALYNQKIFRIIALVIILLVTGFAYMFIARQRLVFEMKEKDMVFKQYQLQQAVELEKQKAAQEHAIAVLKLQEFANLIIEKNKQIELLEQANQDNDYSDVIQKLQFNTILTEEQWRDFKLLFERAHPGFFTRLKEKLPGLSPAETRFVALSKLKLDNKEMASTLGISAHAVRTIGYRLRKKIALPDGESLDKVIEGL